MFSFKSKPKLLIAILACHHRAPHLSAIRETWVPDINSACDYRFFFGRGSHGEVKPDEVILDCDDAYRGLACKVQEACRWAVDHGYEFLFKADDDTYVRPERLMSAGFENDDFRGLVLPATDRYHEHAYARGGTGYWLSRKAMEVLAAAPTPNPDIPSEYAEDSWVGKTLRQAGIECTNDDRLRCADFSGPNRSPRPQGSTTWKRDCPAQSNNFITVCEFLGHEMYPVHELWLASRAKHRILMSKLRVE
jgi:Galactosyltransferase